MSSHHHHHNHHHHHHGIKHAFGLILQSEVADFDKWKAAFDTGDAHRKEAGFLYHHINRIEGSPNKLIEFFGCHSTEKCKTLLNSDAVKAAMKENGVASPPVPTWVNVHVSQFHLENETPGVMVSLDVADFAKWFAAYSSEEAKKLRTACGITGDIVCTVEGKPNSVIVFHQAVTSEELKKFSSNPELNDIMGKFGTPAITFTTGGWGRAY